MLELEGYTDLHAVRIEVRGEIGVDVPKARARQQVHLKSAIKWQRVGRPGGRIDVVGLKIRAGIELSGANSLVSRRSQLKSPKTTNELYFALPSIMKASVVLVSKCWSVVLRFGPLHGKPVSASM